jgi:Fe-S cluster assembly ATPase SufC
MILQKTEIDGVYRESSGALINQDANALAAYKRKKHAQRELETFMQTVKENQERMVHLEMNYKSINRTTTELFNSQKKEIEEMKLDLLEIKRLLLQITHK